MTTATFLINEQNCTFDNVSNLSLKEAKKWARNRGTNYKMVYRINKDSSTEKTYTTKNGTRFTLANN